NDRILRFTEASTYVDDFVPAGAGGMDDLNRLVFGPDGDLYVTTNKNTGLLRFGTESEAVFTVALSTASSVPLGVSFGSSDGTASQLTDYTPTNGTLTFEPGVTTKTIFVPILNDAIAEGSETFTVNLSNPSGAVIADNQAVGTIFDATKF